MRILLSAAALGDDRRRREFTGSLTYKLILQTPSTLGISLFCHLYLQVTLGYPSIAFRGYLGYYLNEILIVYMHLCTPFPSLFIPSGPLTDFISVAWNTCCLGNSQVWFFHVYIYIYIYVCMYVCMYVSIYVCTWVLNILYIIHSMQMHLGIQ